MGDEERGRMLQCVKSTQSTLSHVSNISEYLKYQITRDNAACAEIKPLEASRSDNEAHSKDKLERSEFEGKPPLDVDKDGNSVDSGSDNAACGGISPSEESRSDKEAYSKDKLERSEEAEKMMDMELERMFPRVSEGGKWPIPFKRASGFWLFRLDMVDKIRVESRTCTSSCKMGKS